MRAVQDVHIMQQTLTVFHDMSPYKCIVQTYSVYGKYVKGLGNI